MAYIADFHLWAPRMIKDSETPVWLGLKYVVRPTATRVGEEIYDQRIKRIRLFDVLKESMM